MSTRFRMTSSLDNTRDLDAGRTRSSATLLQDHHHSPEKSSSTASYYKLEGRRMLLVCLKCFSFRTRRRILSGSVKLLILALLFLYGVVPLGLYTFPSILKALIFLNYVNKPLIVNYSDPGASGLPATRNFYIETAADVQVGTWHILPKSLMETGDLSPVYFELSLRSGNPIIVYMHGNSGSRAAFHRVELYKVLKDLDAHVIAFDYRGYGDSSPVDVSEEALVHDGKSVFQWVKQRSGSSPVFVWGHSLGTGVALHGVSELCQEGVPPAGLILESPFNNMSDEVLAHPFSVVFRLVPWYKWSAMSALKSKNMMFDSDKHVSGVTVPILILHAEDDAIVPIELGEKLYEACVDGRPKTMTSSFLVFKAELGYGHRYICKDSSLPSYIRQFLKRPEQKLK